MKIFWSWQSDTPGKIGQYFVRDCLEGAIASLREEFQLDESGRDELELDHDRKGVPGSPDLVKVILDKIGQSDIFIADVTVIGKSTGEKPLINPNVAIELGYALGRLGDSRILMIMNSAYGDRGTLPFDLRHKAGPIIFHLDETSPKEQVAQVKRELTGHLKVAIRDCLSVVSRKVEQVENPYTFKRSVYFTENESLVTSTDISGKDVPYTYPNSPLLYLRVIPIAQQPVLKEAEISDLIYGIKISPLRQGFSFGTSHTRNSYGGMTYSSYNNQGIEHIYSSTQLFRNRELWGIDASLLKGEKLIHGTFEAIFRASLNHYLEFEKKYLKCDGPFLVEAGATGIQGYYMDVGYRYMTHAWGPVTLDEVFLRQNLAEVSEERVNAVLLGIFEKMFDACGSVRPENFGDFPKKST